MLGTSTQQPTLDDEYGVVQWKLTWIGTSLALFALNLPAPHILQWQPWRPDPFWLWPLVKPAVHFALSLLGLATAAVGYRRTPRKGAAKLALLLHGTVVGLVMLMILGMFLILRR